MKKYLLNVVLFLVGALAGLVYYHFFGCTTGCPITSNPYGTMLYMGLVGLIAAEIFRKPQKKES